MKSVRLSAAKQWIENMWIRRACRLIRGWVLVSEKEEWLEIGFQIDANNRDFQ